MDNKTAVASETFRAQPVDRREEARLIAPLLMPGMSIKQVEELLGPPTEFAWNYAVSASAYLVLRFNPDGKLHEVGPIGPDVAQQATEESMEQASAQFKRKSGEREVTIVDLIDRLAPGMACKEVEDLLGRPDESVWSYDLFYSAALDVFLDQEQAIKRVNLLGE